jgi:hypothetical protein
MAFNLSQLKHVVDILMAATHADADSNASEHAVVRAVIAEHAKTPQERAALEKRMHRFRLASFSLRSAAAGLGLRTAVERKAILALVNRLNDGDAVFDSRESDFLVELARAMGAKREEYAGLTIELVN